MLLGGIACIASGEILCIFGPHDYPRAVGLICHVILYFGIVLCGLAVLLRIVALTRRTSR